jgi:branched-chain amino acid transport system substrate-binding protein
MKSKKPAILNWVIVVIVIAVALFMFGFRAESASSEQKKLKMGVVEWLGWTVGLDRVRATEILAEIVNKEGGLDIGGEKYKVELIIYDNNADQSASNAAVNRLIYEDKVKFILGGALFVDGYLPTTEKNKVVVIAGTMSPPIVSPDKHYGFAGIAMFGQTIVAWRKFINDYPDKKNFFCAYPDHPGGHNNADFTKEILGFYGKNVTNVYYPPGAQDLSALGTKVKTVNPDVFAVAGGGPVLDGLAIKAAKQSGYTGVFFAPQPVPLDILKQVVPIDLLEGLIGGASPLEFEPPLTDKAKEFKDAYIAKNGKWDFPELRTVDVWSCMTTALQKAGSLDTDKVAAVLSKGMKFEGVIGSFQMVPRRDLGNSRTTDSVMSYYLKEIVDGKPKLIGTVSLDEAVSYYKNYFK